MAIKKCLLRTIHVILLSFYFHSNEAVVYARTNITGNRCVLLGKTARNSYIITLIYCNQSDLLNHFREGNLFLMDILLKFDIYFVGINENIK